MERKTQSHRRWSLSVALGVTATLAGLATSTVQAEEVQIRMGQIFAPDVPIVRCGAIPLAENDRLKELGLDITIIHSGQLGSEDEMAQQVSSGELEMTGAASSILAAWIEDLSVFETYYLYETVDQAFAAYKTETARKLFEELRDVANLRILGLPWLYGKRHIFGNRALRSPEDFEGLRMRVPETSVSSPKRSRSTSRRTTST